MDNSPSASVGRPEIVQKITRRLIPFVGICYLIAYLDRQNVSFAKLQMVGDLGLSEYAYGLGASLFFIGYVLMSRWFLLCRYQVQIGGLWPALEGCGPFSKANWPIGAYS